MDWKIDISNKAAKQIQKLSKPIRVRVGAVIKKISISGPYRSELPNFSKLAEDIYHCHIKKGKPTYVMIWQVVNKKIKIVEIMYVGTHEKAPY